MLEPDRITDNFGWEPVTLIGIHCPIVHRRRLSCQYLGEVSITEKPDGIFAYTKLNATGYNDGAQKRT